MCISGLTDIKLIVCEVHIPGSHLVIATEPRGSFDINNVFLYGSFQYCLLSAPKVFRVIRICSLYFFIQHSLCVIDLAALWYHEKMSVFCDCHSVYNISLFSGVEAGEPPAFRAVKVAAYKLI